MKIGDVVHNKRNGTKMTVRNIQNESVECIWFDKINRYCKKTFNYKSIMSIEDYESFLNMKNRDKKLKSIGI